MLLGRGDLRAAHLGIAPRRPRHQHHGDERHHRRPGEARLPARNHDQRRQQRAHRISRMPADLEDALRKALLAGRRMARHARGLGMEHGRSEPDHGHRDQDHRVAARERQAEQPGERCPHAGDHRVGPRLMIGNQPEHRLQQRRGHLEGERDQPDLREVQHVRLLEEGIHGRDHRLDQVVEQMRSAQRHQDRQQRAALG